MSTPKEINTTQAAGKKFIDAVNAFINKEIDHATLMDIQDEFETALEDLTRFEMTSKLAKTSQHLQHELNALLSLAQQIDDHHLNKAIINAEKVLEEIGEIGELNYVAINNRIKAF